ncbi:hypothetical protein PMIN04_000481 [Paraphaeosphaeria minitans]
MHRLIESHLLHLRASGNTKTLLSDKRDIGRFVARIIRDPRTLNRSVIAWSDEISQNEILSLIEAKTGETPSVSTVSASRLEAAVSTAERTIKEDPENRLARNAKYLGYLDARELYPDLNPVKFEEYLDDLVEGKATTPYEETIFKTFVGAKGDVKDRFVLRLDE